MRPPVTSREAATAADSGVGNVPDHAAQRTTAPLRAGSRNQMTTHHASPSHAAAIRNGRPTRYRCTNVEASQMPRMEKKARSANVARDGPTRSFAKT